jgi:hypothetical protein
LNVRNAVKVFLFDVDVDVEIVVVVLTHIVVGKKLVWRQVDQTFILLTLTLRLKIIFGSWPRKIDSG